jgi:hypothetical protein
VFRGKEGETGHPLPRFFESVASKGLRYFANRLESTLMGNVQVLILKRLRLMFFGEIESKKQNWGSFGSSSPSVCLLEWYITIERPLVSRSSGKFFG